MVPEDRHQGARGESHLFEPGEQPADLLIHICNFAGVRVVGVSMLERFRRIVRSMWIEIVGPKENILLPILLEPVERTLCDQRSTALGKNTAQVILFDP